MPKLLLVSPWRGFSIINGKIMELQREMKSEKAGKRRKKKNLFVSSGSNFFFGLGFLISPIGWAIHIYKRNYRREKTISCKSNHHHPTVIPIMMMVVRKKMRFFMIHQEECWNRRLKICRNELDILVFRIGKL
jgi:hypothetical protein